MKKFLTLVLLLISYCGIQAQDTTVVQTFTWASETRADTFQFPDDPNAAYRKILMIYNMRCHGNQVGSGNVGCREWDYSCNTFITDPSRLDSTRLMHPSHTISNFSGEQFDYSDEPTYTYYLYEQHETTLVPNNETEAVIGTGTIDMPLAAAQEVTRAQFLLTAEELQNGGLSAGDIQALKMDVSALGNAIDFLKIKIKASNLNELNPDAPELDGFTEVYFQNTAFEELGLKDFNFYQAFDWDGVSNLVVEFSFTTTTGEEGVSVKGEDMGFNAAIFASQSDYALHFAGSGAVIVPTEDFSTISNEITVSLWQYGTPESMPANSYAFEGYDDGDNRQANVHLPWSNSQVYWDCGSDGSNYDRINKTANEADFEGQWNHWAFTKNASTGEMKIFLNGSQWHSGTGKTNPIDITQFKIASSIPGNGRYFGKIDEFRVWNKALDAVTIQTWMRRNIDGSHPHAANLVAYYPINEGEGFALNDASVHAATATVELPNWQHIRGEDLFKNFIASTVRPNFVLVQGEHEREDVVIHILDSIVNPLHQVVEYQVNGTDLVATDTQFVFPAGMMSVYDEAGHLADSILAQASGTIDISALTYYDKRAAKFELLSLVTPYGNGLDLEVDGKTFTFDVTDFAPILKGEKFISLEMGGQWQEEMDIKFLFIEGTPTREVVDIQNIWPFRRGWYGDIQNDVYFEPRQVQLSSNGSYFELKSSITGHGQNGEFTPRNHYLNIDGGDQDFTYEVWKYCGKNPIYPQGGTWIFDRAGWCPGMATDVHTFDLVDYSAGDVIEIDYGVNGSNLTEANYLVSNQLVTYGAYNFSMDASLEAIMRPNNEQVEYERINPACNLPMIIVKNTGANEITSLSIHYTVRGGNALTHEWTGSILPNQSAEIDLPINGMAFWNTSLDQYYFEAAILNVNGNPDEHAANNSATASFTPAKVFEFEDPLRLQMSTNNRPQDNSYTISDEAGNVILSRDNLAANQTYEDMLELAPGCYTFKLEDTGNDGLSFWFFPNNGNGSVRFQRVINENVAFSAQTFNPDFGGGVQFDFVIPQLVNTDNLEDYRLMSVYPNPMQEVINLDLEGFEQEELIVEIIDLMGRVRLRQELNTLSQERFSHRFNIKNMESGMYFIKVYSNDRQWTQSFIKN